MTVTLDVTAPRGWWQKADTYRLSTKQSESTMHTITKRPLEQSDFEAPIYNHTLDHLNGLIEDGMWKEVKAELPEGFLQRRIWKVSYMTLANILVQRRNHRLPQWPYFCREVLKGVDHPELLPKMEE